MGRLFWKIFLLITLVQTVSVVAVGISFTLRSDFDGPRMGPGDCHPCAAEPGADRPPPDRFGPAGGAPHGPPPPDARFVDPDHDPDHDRGPGGRHLVIPPEPVIGGLFASAATAALLAWFMAKPIRALRDAFDAASTGKLDIRISGKMGRGKDELTDLGRDFDAMVERLNALITGQRRLLHDVSHEMRSPLARIQAAIGLANQQPEQADEAMQRIERESVRMDRLIGELLALARLQAGFTGRMDDDIDLRELLAVILDDAGFEARSRNRAVQAHADVDGLVRGNVELLRRALENVVRNAIKYSYDGGTVVVRAAADEAARRAAITVCDSGPGVPESDLEAIFEPFFRGLNGGSADGHGLGLAIAKRIIEAHGGSIRATNNAGGGLCVRIELPLLPAQAP
jgi:two-component system OmpR family sensor kinase